MSNLTKYRRELHQIPEIGTKEHKTQKYLLDTLKAMGYAPKEIFNTKYFLNQLTLVLCMHVDMMAIWQCF